MAAAASGPSGFRKGDPVVIDPAAEHEEEGKQGSRQKDSGQPGEQPLTGVSFFDDPADGVRRRKQKSENQQIEPDFRQGKWHASGQP